MSLMPLGFLASAGGEVIPIELIQTITLASDSNAEIIFSSIPSTYRHLQLRYAIQATTASSGTPGIRFNGDTTNYNAHEFFGIDGNPQTSAQLSINRMYVTPVGDKQNANIIDIYDYAQTNKTKTIRQFAGSMHLGNPRIRNSSGLWNSTAAINTLSLFSNGVPFIAGSRLSLYGIKG